MRNYQAASSLSKSLVQDELTYNQFALPCIFPFQQTMQFCRPCRWICQADRTEHFSGGSLMGREGLQPQMPQICSVPLSLPMHTNKICCCTSLHLLRKIKSGHLKQGEGRIKQNQSSEITTMGPSSICKSNAKGEMKFLQSDSGSLCCHENIFFFLPSFPHLQNKDATYIITLQSDQEDQLLFVI